MARARQAVREVVAVEVFVGGGLSLVPSICMVGPGNPCPLASLRTDRPSLVFPGGEARCLSDADSLYAFRVFPGDADKLYLDFQGGGACFNEYTTIKETMCKTNIDEPPTDGVYDKANPRNPFRTFTIVTVIYCSGDLHVGQTARTYGGIIQRGYANAWSAVQWARSNMSPQLKTLVIGGCSAGALGAQIWAGRLLGFFSYRHAAVLADSYLDLFPGRTQQVLLRDLGVCATDLLSEAQRAVCLAGNLTVHDVFEAAMDAYPSVTFGQVNSKYDETQQHFHEAVAYTSGVPPEITDGASYLAAANVCLRSRSRHANYFSFLADGGQHCFTPYPVFYEATTRGASHWRCPAGHGGNICRLQRRAFKREHLALAEWVAALIAPDAPKRSECSGKRLNEDRWSAGGLSYCDAAQTPPLDTMASSRADADPAFGFDIPFGPLAVVAAVLLVASASVAWAATRPMFTNRQVTMGSIGEEKGPLLP